MRKHTTTMPPADGVAEKKSPPAITIGGAFTERDVLLTRAEVATYLRRSVPTLERWARDGSGPEFKFIGGRALYPLVALRRYAGVDDQ